MSSTVKSGNKANKAKKRNREIYRFEGRRERNKLRKLRKHLVTNPNDNQAVAAL